MGRNNFSIAIPTGVILYWIRPDFLGLPDVDTTAKLIFSAIAGVLFLISLFMIFLGVRQNRKNQAKSQEKKEGEEWV